VEGQHLRHFAIRRDITPGATWTEMDAGAMRLVHGGAFMEQVGDEFRGAISGVKWVRSYWEPGSAWAVCHYIGPDAAAIELWNDICGTPYLDVSEIEVVDGCAGADYPRGLHADPALAPLVVVETAGREFAERGPAWIRTYRLVESGREIQLFGAGGDAPGRRVVELRPEDYE